MQKEEEKMMKQQLKQQQKEERQLIKQQQKAMQQRQPATEDYLRYDDEKALTYLSDMVDDSLKSYHAGDIDSKKRINAVLLEYKKMGLIKPKQKTDIMKLFN